MHITPVKTNKITAKNNDLTKILDRYLLNRIEERSILAITSKIVSICEGKVIKIGTETKENVVHQEAEYYLPSQQSRYKLMLAIKHNLLLPNAGIDESNGNGYYILYPSNPQRTANGIRQYLMKRFSLKKMGVLITDSKTTPLRWGTTGVALAHSGFDAINDYIGSPDLFGRPFQMTKASVLDGLAAAAVLVMGEGREQTPMAMISDVLFVKFKTKNPSQKESKQFHIAIQDDLYAPLLTAVDWKVGKGGSEKALSSIR